MGNTTVNSVAVTSDGQIIAGIGSHDTTSAGYGSIKKLDKDGNVIWSWGGNMGNTTVNSVSFE